MLFLHYYLQKGMTLEYLNNLSFYDKQFMTASMLVAVEDKGQLWDALSA